MTRASAGTATYLGGLPDSLRRSEGRLWFTDELVGIGESAPEYPTIATAQVVSVEITSTQIAKSKVPAAIAFGLVGAMTARGSEKKTMVTVHLRSGGVAFFQIERLDQPFVVGLLAEWISEHAAPAASSEGDVLNALERLATLHRAGDLTDGEFTAAKAKLLS